MDRGVSRRNLIRGAAAAGVVGAVAAGIAVSAEDSEGSHQDPAAGPTPNRGPMADAAAAAGKGTKANAAGGTMAENELPGSPDWRITSTGEPDAIAGYADRVSVLPGGRTVLYISTTSASYTIRAYRIGWYGGDQARLVWQSPTLPGRTQPDPRLDSATRRVSTDWEPSFTLATDGWPEGAYLLKLVAANGHQRYIPLIVRSASAAGRVLMMHAVATWQAYNLWGGYNLYQGLDGSYGTRSYIVGFDRPYDDGGAEKFLVYERAAVVLAERLGLPLAYTTGLDVHTDPGVLTGAHAVFSLGHDEYWTPEQRKYVTAARDAGTNLAFLGANTCFRRVRFEPSTRGENRNVVCYKTSYEADPLYGRNDPLVTNDFRADPDPDPESSMTGVLYEGYPTDAPYVVHNADHWLFEGTGARDGESLPHLVGVEYDRVTPGAPTPHPIEIIAHSPLVCNGTASHSDSAYYTVPSGAGVFASGTMRWVEGLMAGTDDDGSDHGMNAATGAFVTRTTENLMRAFAAGPAGRSRPAPRDNVAQVYA